MYEYGNFSFPYYDTIYSYSSYSSFSSDTNNNQTNSKITNKKEPDNKYNKTDFPKAELSEDEKDYVRKLKQTDTHVRNHEAAHLSIGGKFAGSPSYSFETGPDGSKYAVAGEVPISIQTGTSPDQTIKNAMQIKAAALAPSDPSSADLAVASAADSMMMSAVSEKYKKTIGLSKSNNSKGSLISFMLK